MKKLILIAFSNIKKKKSEMITTGLLITFASLLLFVSLHTFLNLNKVSEESYKNSNLADFEILALSAFEEAACEVVEKKPETVTYEKNEGLRVQNLNLNGVDSKKESTEAFSVFFPVDDERKISRITAGTDLRQFPENGIILTKYMETAKGFQKGEEIKLTFEEHTYTFKVVDFSEDALFATPLNISVSKLFISREMYERIAGENAEVEEIFDLRVRLQNKDDSVAYEKSVIDSLTGVAPMITNTEFNTLNWTDMKNGIAKMPQIAMAIVLCFAIVILFIIFAVLYYNIKNFLDLNMTNTGILKATGYTSRELRLSLVLQFAMIALIGSLLGVTIGSLGGKSLGGFIAAIMGIEWRVGVDIRTLLLTIAIVTGFTVLIVTGMGRKYKKIFVLDALRGGISNHSFKKNSVSLEKSPFSLPVSLGLKGIFMEKKKNIVITLIISFIVFASCISVFLYKNFGSDNKSLLMMTGVEITPVYVTGDTRYEEFNPVEIPGVKDVLYGSNADITLKANGYETTANMDFWDDPKKVAYEIVVEGRLPENDNEIVITGGVQKDLHAEIGDIIYLVSNDKTREYMLVGIDQKINHFGQKAMITLEGMKRLTPSAFPAAAYLTLEDGENYETMKERIGEAFPNAVINDGANTIDSVFGGIMNIVYIICFFFLVATYIVVSFILYMIGKSRIIEQKKELGISKAIGYTTGQLVFKNIVSIIPLVVVGSLLGMLLTYLFTNPLLSGMFYTIGFGKFSYPHFFLQYLVVIIFLIIDALAVTIIFSLRIRKIEPVKMIRE